MIDESAPPKIESQLQTIQRFIFPNDIEAAQRLDTIDLTDIEDFRNYMAEFADLRIKKLYAFVDALGADPELDNNDKLTQLKDYITKIDKAYKTLNSVLNFKGCLDFNDEKRGKIYREAVVKFRNAAMMSRNPEIEARLNLKSHNPE
ncbi:MAG: hypothetical protein ABID45_00575 [Patescibacteria group bacterium]